MTTVGYGNTAPTTEGARAMVFTLGFFSILLFAGILANAGSVVTAIVDDVINRAKLSYFNRPWASALFWGAMYYLWMVLIASYYQYWVGERLEETIDYDDSYWFACKFVTLRCNAVMHFLFFNVRISSLHSQTHVLPPTMVPPIADISTTTVGLGDYYLEHGVIIGSDLLVWPLLFLFGFVLLSSFLTKVAEFLASFFPSDRPSFADRLADADVPLFPCLKKKKNTASGSAVVDEQEEVVDCEGDDGDDGDGGHDGDEEGAVKED